MTEPKYKPYFVFCNCCDFDLNIYKTLNQCDNCENEYSGDNPCNLYRDKNNNIILHLRTFKTPIL